MRKTFKSSHYIKCSGRHASARFKIQSPSRADSMDVGDLMTVCRSAKLEPCCLNCFSSNTFWMEVEMSFSPIEALEENHSGRKHSTTARTNIELS